MSNTQYLEIDSTYRNRKDWENASEFDVLISQSGRRTADSAVDPVSLAAPITSWRSNNFNGNIVAGENVSVKVIPTTLGITTSVCSLIVQQNTNNKISEIDNYYLKAMIGLQSIPTGEKRVITSYEYLNNNTARICVSPPFSTVPVAGVELTIYDPSDLSLLRLFVPNGRNGDNAYQGCFIYNETLNDSREIISYSGGDHTLECDGTGWDPKHNYSIRREEPALVLTQPNIGTINSVEITGGSTVNGFYTGKYIRVRPTYYPSTVNAEQDPPITNVPDRSGEIRRIIYYTGRTVDANNVIQTTPRIAHIKPFSKTPLSTDTFELLNVSYDNHNPFNYNGSRVSNQQNQCYQIELINLILPNQTLATGYGSTLSSYPYVYVKIHSYGSVIDGSIYSNNPNATKMLFRAPIKDTTGLTTTSFVKLDGDGMVQTIKFNISDNLHFGVYLPNGELFGTTLPETEEPLEPNALSQISALFSIKKL